MLGTPDVYKNYLETEIKRLSALGDNITKEEYERLENLKYQQKQILEDDIKRLSFSASTGEELEKLKDMMDKYNQIVDEERTAAQETSTQAR